jgi:hypothetical protein
MDLQPGCKYFFPIFWYVERLCRESLLPQRRVLYSGCCSRGSVSLPIHHPFPEPLYSLVRFDGDRRCSNFMHLIRQYNSLFAFTSIGVHIDQSINTGSGPYVFCINGVVHHWIGSLLPADSSQPEYAQLYIYDTSNEVQNRLSVIPSERDRA